MGLIEKAGKLGIINLLGSHAVFGGVITVLAVVAWLAYEYSRLERSGRFLAYVLTTRWVAITLTVLSIIFMGTRFISVVSAYGGV